MQLFPTALHGNDAARSLFAKQCTTVALSILGGRPTCGSKKRPTKLLTVDTLTLCIQRISSGCSVFLFRARISRVLFIE